ncbi:MAG: Gmad2 immunoglobulin-like domain-containing protein [Patescibacteria group bacterium]
MNKVYFFGFIIIAMIISMIFLRCTAPADKSQTEVALFSGSAAGNEARAGEVIVSQPLANEIVRSPLTVVGQAKGYWFFEAILPVRLEDTKGNIIAIAPGQAQSEWMTDNLVPFKATLDFIAPVGGGYLVIAKDNPSGLPENDAAVKIPVNF